MFRASLSAALLSPLVLAAVAQNAAAPTAPVAAPSAAPVEASPASAELPAQGPAKIVFSQCHVDGQYIAMTFDDGPHAENTPRLLDMLKKRNIKATFFVVGECAAEHPEIMKRIVAEGHEIANHSWSHPLLSKMGEEAVSSQLQRTHDVIVATTGVTPKLMRPPYGGFTPNQRGWANKKWGYKIILWDVDPLDWKYRNASRVEAEILKQTVPGSIVLSHDIHKTTVDAMPQTLDALAAKGFKFVTVSELLAMDRPHAGKSKATPTPNVPPEPATSAPAVNGETPPESSVSSGAAPAAAAAPRR
jgi:peptidoglycan/xylan/chitin deacetylase (PgdA/CDA1 family)